MSDLAFVYKWVDNRSPRTLLLLHGTGGDETALLSLGEMIDPSANFLGLRGNSREEGTNRFFRRLEEGVFDEEDLASRTVELHEFLLAAQARKVLQLDQTIAVGYSNGANIAASLLLAFPGAIGGAILLRAMAPYRKVPLSDKPNSPALLISGTRDPIVPAQERTLLIQELKSVQCAVTSHEIPAGHELTRKDVDLSTEWLATLA